MSKQAVCANCGDRLDYYGGVARSALWDDQKFELCVPCFLREDALIDEQGTNVLPGMIAHYKRTIAGAETKEEKPNG